MFRPVVLLLDLFQEDFDRRVHHGFFVRADRADFDGEVEHFLNIVKADDFDVLAMNFFEHVQGGIGDHIVESEDAVHFVMFQIFPKLRFQELAADDKDRAYYWRGRKVIERNIEIINNTYKNQQEERPVN